VVLAAGLLLRVAEHIPGTREGLVLSPMPRAKRVLSQPEYLGPLCSALLTADPAVADYIARCAGDTKAGREVLHLTVCGAACC
jgi:hypothetical protein